MKTDTSFQNQFDEYFSAFKPLPVAVYGTGKNAELIVKHIRGYDFFALVSSDSAGGTAYGKKIITIEEAVKRAGMILIAAIPSSTGIIYARIKDIVPREIPVYDMRGQRLDGEEYYKNNAYWECRLCDLYGLVDSHEVISFDVFDTLIMRRILKPSDVFLVMENKIKKDKRGIPFAGWRTEAEERAGTHTCSPTIDEIYGAMKELHGLDEDCIREWKQMEIETELELVCRRDVMAKLLDYAYGKGKKIYLTTDMYFPGDILERILDRCGIGHCYELLISCENKASKENGMLYRILKAKEKGKRILHIGDNYVADVENAVRSGLDAFRVMSGYDILALSSIACILEEAGSLDGKKMLGYFIADMFNDPFVLNAGKGKVQLNTFHSLAHCFLPVTALFLEFILEKSRLYDVILFASRDGYFLDRLYQMASPGGKDLEGGAKGLYFYTSRSAVNSSVIFDETDLYTVCSKILEDPRLNVKYFLKVQFGIEADGELDITSGQAVERWGREGLWERILSYKERIVGISGENRKKYSEYIKSLGIGFYGRDSSESVSSGSGSSVKTAVVDIVTQGTLVYGLSKLTGNPVDLISLGTSAMPNGYVQDLKRVSSVYGNVNRSMDGTAYSLSDFSELHLFLEVIYASCEGQFAGFDQNGGIITLDNEYDCGLICGIQQELENMMRENNFFRGWKIPGGLALAFLRILYGKNSDMPEGMRKRFRFRDPYDPDKLECNLMDCIG